MYSARAIFYYTLVVFFNLIYAARLFVVGASALPIARYKKISISKYITNHPLPFTCVDKSLSNKANSPGFHYAVLYAKILSDAAQKSYVPSIVHLICHLARALANTDTGPVGEHASGDVHRCQLLEKQLGRVWNVHLRNLGLVTARSALERLGVELAAQLLVH